MTTMRFPEAAEAVKNTLDIVEVVQRHVPLKRTGRNFSGLCPFHRDKNPSMSVHREKGIFKCFSCGEGGDALAFLMKLENKTYGELIRELAEEQGIQIVDDGQSPEVAAQKRDIKQKILELNDRSCRWFEAQIQTPEAESVRVYLANRQMPPELIQRFHLGFAPPGWENLAQHLRATMDVVRAEPNILEEAGLVTSKEGRQSVYDRFRNRLIVPIHDEKGQVVAFGGRALSDEDKPKYLNSPETPVYIKNRTLYGLHLAAPQIRQTRTAVVMEGYFDVMAAHTNGITQTVGSCGTALTEGHLKLLVRFGAETVYLAFDSDEAGQNAALSAIQLIEPYLKAGSLQVRVLLIPEGKDPDDFFRQHPGPEAFSRLLDEALHYLDFKFQRALSGENLDTSEGRVNAANRITPLLASIDQPVMRSEYMRKYAERLKLSEEALILEVKRYEQVRNSSSGIGRSTYLQKNFTKKAISNHGRTSLQRNQLTLPDRMSELRSPLQPRHIVAAQNLLRLLLLNDETCLMMLPTLDNLTLPDPRHQSILADLRDFAAEGPSGPVGMEETRIIGTFIRNLNHKYREQPDLQHILADLILTAEELSEQLGLETHSPAQRREQLARFAAEQRHIIDTDRQRQQARQQQAGENLTETDEIELQYRLNLRLAASKGYRKKFVDLQHKGMGPNHG